MSGNEVLEMKYTLFNKNVPAVDLEIDEWYGHVSKVTKIHNLEVLPLLAKFNHNWEWNPGMVTGPQHPQFAYSGFWHEIINSKPGA